MGEKYTNEEISLKMGCAAGSTAYLIRSANSKMIVGLASKLNISYYHALMHYATFCSEEYASIYDCILPYLQEAIKQEVLKDKIHK